MSATTDRKPRQISMTVNTAIGIMAALLLLIAAAGAYELYVRTRAEPTAADSIGVSAPRLPTETLFLGNWAGDATEEWRSARADHRLIAYLVSACRWHTELYTLTQEQFGALFLDLTPKGDHSFTKPAQSQVSQSSQAQPPSQMSDAQPIARAFSPATPTQQAPGDAAKSGNPLLALSDIDRRILVLSDTIARTRLNADFAAQDAEPKMLHYGYATIGIAAIVTLLVTLQSRFSGTHAPPPPRVSGEKPTVASSGATKDAGEPAGAAAANPPAPAATATTAVTGDRASWQARWLAIAALIFSVGATALAGLKQYFDPSRAYEHNERALLSLRRLHDEVAMGFACNDQSGDIEVKPDLLAGWAKRLARQRSNIIPVTATFAAIGSSDGEE